MRCLYYRSKMNKVTGMTGNFNNIEDKLMNNETIIELLSN